MPDPAPAHASPAPPGASGGPESAADRGAATVRRAIAEGLSRLYERRRLEDERDALVGTLRLVAAIRGFRRGEEG